MHASTSAAQSAFGDDEGSSSMNVAGDGVSQLDRTHSVEVIKLTEREDISDTPSLVAAFNKEDSTVVRDAMREWLTVYVNWFSEKMKTTTAEDVVQQYACLSHVVTQSPEDKKLLTKFLAALGEATIENRSSRKCFAESLAEALRTIDNEVFMDDCSVLFNLANDLISILDPKSMPFTRLTHSSNGATMHALHETFLAIQRVCWQEIYAGEYQNIYATFAQKLKEIRETTNHYPTKFQVKMIEQLLECPTLEHDSPTSVIHRLYRATSGFFYVYHGMRAIATADVDHALLETGIKRIWDARGNVRSDDRVAFECLTALGGATTLVLKDPNKLALFMEHLRITKSMLDQLNKPEDRKAVTFGVICQLRVLAVRGTSDVLRDTATNEIIALYSERSQGPLWHIDAEVWEAILDAFQDLCVTHGTIESVNDAVNKIMEGGDNFAKEAVNSWMGDESLQSKLTSGCESEKRPDDNKLFNILKKEIIAIERKTKLSRHKDNLVATYQQSQYTQVQSLFDNQKSMHVKLLKFHTIAYEEKEVTQVARQLDETQANDHVADKMKRKERRSRVVTTRDLFSKTLASKHQASKEVTKILFYGDPGTGKTSLSKKLIYEWTAKTWGESFQFVYLLPIREINALISNMGTSARINLETVIAQICFPSVVEEHLDSIKHEILTQLNAPSTLVILDGLDESNEKTKSLVETAMRTKCKVIVLSRPYNLHTIREHVDVEVECLGLNDSQLKEYIQRNLPDDKNRRVSELLKANPAAWEICHVPMNLNILCFLWKECEIGELETKIGSSLCQMYDDMVNSLYVRYSKAYGDRKIGRDELFKALRSIAFDAMKNGEILISQSSIRKRDEDGKIEEAARESGFLFFKLEGDRYQFPHLTFQEYFAGKHLAAILGEQRESPSLEDGFEFLSTAKYLEKYRVTLSFTMQELWQLKGMVAFNRVLDLVEEGPVDVIGIEHLLLRLRLLNDCLSMPRNPTMLLANPRVTSLKNAIAKLFNASKLDKSKHMFERLVQAIEEMPNVLQYCDDIFGQAFNNLKESVSLLVDQLELSREGWKRVGKLAKYSAGLRNEITAFFRRESELNDNELSDNRIRQMAAVISTAGGAFDTLLQTFIETCTSKLDHVRFFAMKQIAGFVATVPERAEALIDLLSNGCGDSNPDVRKHAINEIAGVVAAVPDRAETMIDLLSNGCGDSDPDVRNYAVKQIANVVAAVPEHTETLMGLLSNGCGDSDSYVRHYAINQIAGFVATVPERAEALIDLLSNGCGDSNPDVRKHAINEIAGVVAAVPDRAETMIDLLSNGCGDSNPDVRRYAVKQIANVVAAVPEHTETLMGLLSNGCGDSEYYVRQHAMVQIAGVVAAVPEHAETLIGLLSNGCGDSDSYVRYYAINQIAGFVATVPERAEALIDLLSNGCGDSNPDVRKHAINEIAGVVAAVPDRAETMIDLLSNGCGDSNPDVRKYAINEIAGVVAAVPEHAETLIGLLSNGCGDSNPDVRKYAINEIAGVVAAVPEHAEPLIGLLSNGCGDSEYYVRQYAMVQIAGVVAAVPEHAETLIGLLSNGCGDSEYYVRFFAMKQIAGVVAAVPEHAESLIGLLSNGCGDSEYYVRFFAMKQIAGVVAAVPEHAETLIDLLPNGCGDSDYDVRWNAIEQLSNISMLILLRINSSMLNKNRTNVLVHKLVCCGGVFARYSKDTNCHCLFESPSQYSFRSSLHSETVFEAIEEQFRATFPNLYFALRPAATEAGPSSDPVERHHSELCSHDLGEQIAEDVVDPVQSFSIFSSRNIVLVSVTLVACGFVIRRLRRSGKRSSPQ